MGNIMDARRRILLNTPHIETASGGVANFKTDMIAPLKGCKVNFLPKQSGSGDPSPTNIRPISGWDGVEVYQTGVNIWDGEIENGGIDDTTGEKISASQVRSKNYIPVKQNTNYYASFADVVGGGGLWVYGYDFNKNFIGRIRPIDIGSSNNAANKTIKTPDGTSYLLIKMQGGTRYDRISINYPSTYTQYHPYTASTFPISWAQQGTVYGGYVDLVSGEVWAEWAELNKTGYTVGEYGGYKSARIGTATPFDVSVSNRPPSSIGAYSNQVTPFTWIRVNAEVIRYSFPNDYTYEQIESLMASFQLVLKLETPQLIATLTPTQIKTLKGINNIYSDADSAEVKFWTH